MLSALVKSAARFQDVLSPVGYEERSIKWVIDIDPTTGHGMLRGPYGRGVLSKNIPSRGDRSGTISEDNLKPALLVDKATYALGIAESGKGKKKEEGARLAHAGFKELLKQAHATTNDAEVGHIVNFLEKALPGEILSKVKPSDIVAFRVAPDVFPFDKEAIRNFWVDHLRSKYAIRNGQCGICGKPGPLLRILPWQIAIFDESCPLSSFNAEAFCSFGKKQTENAPLCFDCAATASQVLQHLVGSERHSAVLAKDEGKGKEKSPLKNHLAVFWLKDHAQVEIPGTDEVIDPEKVSRALLNADVNAPPAAPPPEIDQLKRLLSIPWQTDKRALKISKNSFYLAVLSPNKSRLVVREWFEENIERVCQNLKKFLHASTIVHPDGREAWPPSIPSMLEALKPEKSRDARVHPELMRGLLRNAYLGTLPPHGLLELSVERFRIPEKRSLKPKEKEKQALRRMALAAAMKLVLTYGREEVETMEVLDEKNMSQAYLCGMLLAILEEIQQQASDRKLNTTLVDRFYGSASTAPQSVFGNLLGTTTKAHLPKLRRADRGYKKMEEILEQTMQKLDEAGGFPHTLTLKKQAEFALGFYHQRARFRKEQAQKPPAEVQTDDETKNS